MTIAVGKVQGQGVLPFWLTSGRVLHAHPDKDYSLTDSASMVTIRVQGMNEALMRDAHFVQEGFALLP